MGKKEKYSLDEVKKELETIEGELEEKMTKIGEEGIVNAKKGIWWSYVSLFLMASSFTAFIFGIFSKSGLSIHVSKDILLVSFCTIIISSGYSARASRAAGTLEGSISTVETFEKKILALFKMLDKEEK